MTCRTTFCFAAQTPAPPTPARHAAAACHVGLQARLLLALLHRQVLHGVCVLGCQAADAQLQLPHAVLYQRCPAPLAPRQPASSVAAHQLRDFCVAPSQQRSRQKALHAVDDRRRCRRQRRSLRQESACFSLSTRAPVATAAHGPPVVRCMAKGRMREQQRSKPCHRLGVLCSRALLVLGTRMACVADRSEAALLRRLVTRPRTRVVAAQ